MTRILSLLAAAALAAAPALAAAADPGIPALTGKYEDTRVYTLALAADFRL